MSVGQGLETALSQLVAERFGVALEQVRYQGGDTDLLPGGKGNGGSGALCIGGSAVIPGSGQGDREAAHIAAEVLEAAVVDVEWRKENFRIAGTDRSVDLAAVGQAVVRSGAVFHLARKVAWSKAGSSPRPRSPSRTARISARSKSIRKPG